MDPSGRYFEAERTDIAMHTTATIAKHPVHPMLVDFLVGLWISFRLYELIGSGVAAPAVCSPVAMNTTVSGFIGALAAVAPRFMELLFCKGDARSVVHVYGVGVEGRE